MTQIPQKPKVILDSGKVKVKAHVKVKVKVLHWSHIQCYSEM